MTAPTRRALREEQPRRRSAPARLLLSAAAVAGAVLVGVVAGGGTFAVWNATASVASAATVKAGSSNITVSPLPLSAAGLYPGRTVYGTSTIKNVGTTPLALSLDAVAGPRTATAFSSALTVSVGVARSAADCAAGRIAPAVTASLGTAPRAVLLPSIAPGASTLVCVGVGLPANAPAAAAGAASIPLTLTVSGTQVRA